MPRHSRQHSEATQIVEQILKEADEPRQATSGKETLDRKKTPVSVPPQTSGGNRGGKTRAAPKKFRLAYYLAETGELSSDRTGPRNVGCVTSRISNARYPIPRPTHTYCPGSP